MKHLRILLGGAMAFVMLALFMAAPTAAAANAGGGTDQPGVDMEISAGEATPGDGGGANEEGVSTLPPVAEAQIPPITQMGFAVSSVKGTGDAAVFEPGSRKSDHFADFSFGQVQTMSGIFSTIGLYVTMPNYTVAENATLRVSYTCSDLILESLSSLTFYLNGTPFFSCPVVHTVEGPTILYIDVPMHLFQEEYNLLEIGGYVRLTWDEGCIDDYMGANWINFEKETTLRVGYSLVSDMNYLAYFPFPFLSFADSKGAELAVVVSDRAENGEIEAALFAMASLGSTVDSDNEIAFGRYGEAKRRNTILFSLAQNLPQDVRQAMGDFTVPQNGALLKRLDQGGGDWLVVVSETGQGLIEAARLLTDPTRIAQIWTDDHNVSNGEADILIANRAQLDTVVQGQYTMREIVGHGIRFSGPFHQEATIYLPVPNDYMLSSESKFSLKFRYSENIDFDRSLMTVYWGDVPIASKKLSLENAGGDSLTFTTPGDLIGAIGSYIRVAFELEVKDLICTPRQMDMPWAYVTEDSTVFLPLGRPGALSLSNRPAPFQRDGIFNDVMCIVSNEPNAAELTLLGRTISMLGTGSSPYGDLKVIRASEFYQADSDYNIITVGTAQDNAFIRSINPWLYFLYDQSYTRLLSNEKLALAPTYAATIGAAELIYSPFSQGRAILALTSPGREGIERLTDLVSIEELRWNLADDVILIDDRLRLTSYQCYVPDEITVETPSFFEALAANKESVTFTLIALGVMLIMLMSVVLVLVRIRIRNKKGE